MKSKSLHTSIKRKKINTINSPTDNNDKPNDKGAIQLLLPHIWMLIPAMLLFKIVGEYTYNIPKLDDYDAILKFIIDFKKADFSTRLYLLFSQHNEHRILTSRIIYLLQYYLTGTINFKNIIYIGNLQLIPIFVLLACFIKRFTPSLWPIPAFAAALCIFDLGGYDNSGFAMAAIQNYGVVMYFLLSLYFYHTKGKHSIWIAPLLQIACTFSSGNGVIASMVIAASVLFTDKREFKIISIATFIIFTGLYFIGYHSTGDPNHKMGTLGQIIPFFLLELGAHFGFDNAKYWGGLILILVVFFSPISWKLKLNKEAVPLLAILFFAIMSLAASAIFRSSTENMQLAYAARYFVYNNMITAILFCLIFVRIYRKKSQWPVTAIMSVILLVSYKHNYDYGVSNYQLQEYRLLTRPYYYFAEKTEIATHIAEESCKLDIYCIEENR